MAIVTRRKTREQAAIKQFREELLGILPLDDKIFFAMLGGADLLPLGSGDMVNHYSTRAEKVAFYLDKVIKPGAETYLPLLLKVMKDCDHLAVTGLAEKIEAMIRSDDVCERQSRKEKARKDAEECASVDSKSTIDVKLQSTDAKMYELNQELQLMKKQYAKRLRQIERQCNMQSMELNKQRDEIKLVKDENYHLKIEIQRLEITLLKYDNYHLKAKVQQLVNM